MNSCIVCKGHAFIPYLKSQKYSITRCLTCGLRFLEPQPTAKELAALYSQDYFISQNAGVRGYSEYVSEASNHRRTFRNRLRLLPRPERGSSLMDLGAATGFFVEQARLAGWDAQGIEPSAWASRHARETLGQPVFTGTLGEAQVPESSFDVVTMWEVIEHLPDPRTLLAGVTSILKPGGYLALSTPDAGSFVARLFGKRWLGWRKIPEHLFFFDFPTLNRLLVDTGFEVLKRRYVSITVDAEFALNRLCDLTGVPRPILPSAIANTSVDVNPFYDLFVLARLTRAR
jgi:2-polyprenyl-3-methyl-5-hydroxy-6-metoxy-1,4-benzoquinol methylase